MKLVYIITSIISCVWVTSGCFQTYSNVKSITVTVDPDNLEDKYKVIKITDKDSVQAFMDKLNNRKPDIWKFYPTFSIEINHSDKIDTYWGSANHIKDAEGHTYELLEKDWEIFKY